MKCILFKIVDADGVPKLDGKYVIMSRANQNMVCLSLRPDYKKHLYVQVTELCLVGTVWLLDGFLAVKSVKVHGLENVEERNKLDLYKQVRFRLQHIRVINIE